MNGGRTVTRRAFLGRIGGLGAGIGVSALTGGRTMAGTVERPNIIFIMADDLGYGDLGCFGQKLIRTPVLDRMAAQGMRFTKFHAGFHVCLPSRCTLMTGLHTGHARCRVNGGGGNHPTLAEEDTTVATVMRAAGYRTAMIGKWSLGDEFVGCVVDKKNTDGGGAIYKHGWDYYFGEPNQTTVHSYYLDPMYRHDRLGLLGPKTDGKRLVPVPFPDNRTKRTHYSHDLLTAKALAFVDAAKDGPFFLYLPYTVPHPKLEIPDLEPYAAEASWTQGEKVYASMITRMDRDIGRILDRLKKHGIDRRTLVIFTSDNGSARPGPFDSNGGLAGSKGKFQLGGVRVPCVAYWPGTVEAGTRSDELLAFWDVLPTLAELAGIDPPRPIDGLSFVPALLGRGRQQHHKYLFFRGGKAPAKSARPAKPAPAPSKKKPKSPGYLIVRNEGETRSDAEIIAEAWTEVVVPKFTKSK